MLSLVLTNRDRSLPSSLRGYGRARVFARGVLFLFLSSCAENFQGALWLVADRRFRNRAAWAHIVPQQLLAVRVTLGNSFNPRASVPSSVKWGDNSGTYATGLLGAALHPLAWHLCRWLRATDVSEGRSRTGGSRLRL